MSKSFIPAPVEEDSDSAKVKSFSALTATGSSFPEAAFGEVVRFIKGKHRTGEEDLPKVRATAEHYQILASKDEGVNDGVIVKKIPKTSHESRGDHDASHPYYRETLVKKYLKDFTVSDSGSLAPDSFGNIERSIQELIALHMINLANHGFVESSKAMIINNGEELPEIAVRFHKDFKTIESLQKHEPEKLTQIDAGAALAQSFWIGDRDGHQGNLGIVGDSTRAIRIDFDLAFNSRIKDIINDAEEEPSNFPFFVESLSCKSFADELEKLSNMDYHNSPQFTKLIDIVFASYQAHSGIPIEEEDKDFIKTNISESLQANSIQMKFLAQIAKINVLLKETSALNESHIEQIRACADRLATLKDENPTFAKSALRNVGTIFRIANVELAKKREVVAMVSDPGIQKALREGLSEGGGEAAHRRRKDRALHTSLLSITRDLKKSLSAGSSTSRSRESSSRSSSQSRSSGLFDRRG
jgi:hypothetical protein